MDIQLKKAAIDFMRNRNWDTFMGLVDSGLTMEDMDTLSLKGYINEPSDFKWIRLPEVNKLLGKDNFLGYLFDPIKLFKWDWYINITEQLDFNSNPKLYVVEFIYNLIYGREGFNINLGDEVHLDTLNTWGALFLLNQNEDDPLKQREFTLLIEVFNSLEYTYKVDEFNIVNFKRLYKGIIGLFTLVYLDADSFNLKKKYLNNILKENANFITTVDEVVNLIITRFEELGLGEAKDVGALRVNKLLYYCLRRMSYFITIEEDGDSEFTFTDILFNSDADFTNYGVVVPGYNNSVYDEWVESYNRDSATPLLDRYPEVKGYIIHCIDELITHSQFLILQASMNDIRKDSGVDLVSEVDGKRYVYLSDMVCYS